MKIRYCRVEKCKKPLPPDRYFKCHKCQPDLPTEDPWDEALPDMDWTNNPVDKKGTKSCNKCLKEKPKTEFTSQRQPHGCNLRPRCKPCDNQIRREQDKARRQKSRLAQKAVI